LTPEYADARSKCTNASIANPATVIRVNAQRNARRLRALVVI
jgi:hypothetical protein